MKFWLNKTTAFFELASCVSRVIVLDKETSWKAEIIKQKQTKNTCTTKEPPQSQWFKRCLVSLPRNKLIPMLNTFPLFSRGFSNAECIKKSYHLKSSNVLWLLFFVVCSVVEICFVLFLNQKKAETLARIIYTRYVNLHIRQFF